MGNDFASGGLFVRYLRTASFWLMTTPLYPRCFVHFAIPFGLFIWAIIDTHSAAAVRAYFANAMTAISVIRASCVVLQ